MGGPSPILSFTSPSKTLPRTLVSKTRADNGEVFHPTMEVAVLLWVFSKSFFVEGCGRPNFLTPQGFLGRHFLEDWVRQGGRREAHYCLTSACQLRGRLPPPNLTSGFGLLTALLGLNFLGSWASPSFFFCCCWARRACSPSWLFTEHLIALPLFLSSCGPFCGRLAANFCHLHGVSSAKPSFL